MVKKLFLTLALVTVLSHHCTLAQIMSRHDLKILITPRVVRSDSVYIYQYKILNERESLQRFEVFRLEVGDFYQSDGGSLGKFFDPKDWYGWFSNTVGQPIDSSARGIVMWVAEDSISNYSGLMVPALSSLAPSDSVTLSFESKGLPSIKRFWAAGWAKSITEQEYDSLLTLGYSHSDIFKSWYEDAYKGITIAPQLPQRPFNTMVFLDTLISYTNQSLTLGWIANQLTIDKYTTLFSAVRSQLQLNNTIGARLTLTTVLSYVTVDSSATLTSEAYALLKYNTEYLLSKLPVVTEPTNDLTAKTKVEITSANGGSLQYSYTITNEAASSQSVANIYVEDITTSTITAPANWQTEKIGTILDRFYTTTSANQITAGTTKSGYSLTSNSLPVIGKVYIQSERYAVDTTDIKTNSYIVTTVTPAIKLAQINTSAFIDTLISYNNRAYSLGWMQYYWVRDNNYYQLNNAKTMINMNIPASAVVILTAFESWLDTIKSLAYTNDEGYALLKYNSIFLREKLSGQ